MAEESSQDKFDFFAAEIRPRLVRYCCGYLAAKNPRLQDRAEDCASSALTKLYAVRERYQRSSWPPVAFRAARNECVDLLRQERRLIPMPVDAPAFDRQGSRSQALDLDLELDREHIRRHIKRCFGKLSHQEQSCLVLAHFCELSMQEIAARLGITAGGVGAILHRARQRLSACVNGN
ncbi:MAG: sigma-70 family RNA polymerase sigma factor [Planctomycetes bacterium]|nr:sigma-70 family RNA polymerase sigma factor [Planctomycetota bacterium]